MTDYPALLWFALAGSLMMPGQSRTLLALREDYRSKLGKDHRAHALLDALFVNPYTTIVLAASQLGVSAPTAEKTIKKLESVGMLHVPTGKTWGRTWLASPILDAVNRKL